MCQFSKFCVNRRHFNYLQFKKRYIFENTFLLFTRISLSYITSNVFSESNNPLLYYKISKATTSLRLARVKPIPSHRLFRVSVHSESTIVEFLENIIWRNSLCCLQVDQKLTTISICSLTYLLFASLRKLFFFLLHIPALLSLYHNDYHVLSVAKIKDSE